MQSAVSGSTGFSALPNCTIVIYCYTVKNVRDIPAGGRKIANLFLQCKLLFLLDDIVVESISAVENYTQYHR